MNEKAKRFLGVIVCIMFTLFLIHRAEEFLRPDYSGDCVNAQVAFDQQPLNSLDVIVFGSSHAWKGFDCEVARNEFNLSLYNYGSNWQHGNTTALYFYDSLRTQSPKVVVIECYLIGWPLVDSDINGEIYYTRKIHNLPEKKTYLGQCFGKDYKKYLSYYMPLLFLHSNWSSIDKNNFLDSVTVEDLSLRHGYLPSDKVTPVQIEDWRKFEQKELNEAAIYVLDGIVERCRQEKIDIIFYTAPYQGDNFNHHDALAEYAENNGCVYIDMFECYDEIGFDSATDFQDGGHLNNNGSEKVARYISQYIVDNYGL